MSVVTGQLKPGEVKSKRSCQVKSSQDRSRQVGKGQVKSEQVKSSQNRSSQARTDRVKSRQVKSNQNKSGQVIQGRSRFCQTPLRLENPNSTSVGWSRS